MENKLNFKIMKESKKYSGEFISLYDHLGHAAGGKLEMSIADALNYAKTTLVWE
jgi:hypothetical protein